jgi:mRNA-degrading endonuclease toxin of MazEF toxin-antitoxin module
VRLERRIGNLSAKVMEQLKVALAFALDLDRSE